ncbi:MAG: GtrA family protein [Gallionella sp.]|nr:GtrA family protein [Gallionella sp.]MDH4286822.1 GtrA family protein [Gallionella sp.]
MKLIASFAGHPITAWFFKKRFIRFCTVGASGVVVNLGVLYLCQEYLFVAIGSPDMRLNVSLAVAIFCATINNFFWNRAWTWNDRIHHPDKHLVLHFGQYALACWVGIVVQVILTKLLVIYLYYLVANALAIVFASVFNFLVNNFWTFRSHKPVDEIALPIIPEPDDEQRID